MSTYISLVNYTQDGIAAIKDSPKRLSVVKRLAKNMGGKVKHFYLTLGSTGAIRTKTLTAFTEAEYREIIAALA